ncbi:hypothetical protein BMS3Abin03_00644 [bacterium BMS3Abin03]|nr:hypothetical protein BMS3Abin03_00644 [bacterium BMS3Abin03]
MLFHSLLQTHDLQMTDSNQSSLRSFSLLPHNYFHLIQRQSFSIKILRGVLFLLAFYNFLILLFPPLFYYIGEVFASLPVHLLFLYSRDYCPNDYNFPFRFPPVCIFDQLFDVLHLQRLDSL